MVQQEGSRRSPKESSSSKAASNPFPLELDPNALLSGVAINWKLTQSIAAIPKWCIK